MIGTFRKTRTYQVSKAHDLTQEGLNFCQPNLIDPQETVYMYPGTKNRHVYMVGGATACLRKPIASYLPRLVLSLTYRAKMDGCF